MQRKKNTFTELLSLHKLFIYFFLLHMHLKTLITTYFGTLELQINTQKSHMSKSFSLKYENIY